MNDATSREAATEAASVSGLALLADDADKYLSGLDELASYLLACRLFEMRVGEPPNAAQRNVLMQQVRRNYVDGRPWEVSHDDPAPKHFDQLDVTAFVTASDADRFDALADLYVKYERLHGSPITPATKAARAEHAAERMDGLTIAEAAEQTGTSARAIRARVDRGTLRAWKGPDGKRRIPRVDLAHAGLLDATEADAMIANQAMEGSGSGSAANAAGAETGLVLALWEKAEQAVREATEHRMLTVQAESRLREAEDAAKRFEEALHEARSEAAVAKAEAEQLRQRLEGLAVKTENAPAHEEDSPAQRRWFRRRR